MRRTGFSNVLDMSTSPPFTLGIIGAGNVVSANHLPVLEAMPEVQISWITDKDNGRAARVAQAYGIADRDLAGGLDNFPKTDAVLMAIPFGVREPYYTALAQRGDAVYVEKPFARDCRRASQAVFLVRRLPTRVRL